MHVTLIYYSNRANNDGIQANPTAQLSGSNDYNTHRQYSVISYYNTTPAHTDNRYYNIHRQSSDDNSIDDTTITADMITESNWNTHRQVDSVTYIPSASNDNTQRPYTHSIYISGSNMYYTGNGASKLERPTIQEVE
jgi:hypothetical protein